MKRLGLPRLTAAQRAILRFVIAHRKSKGFAPTLREIGTHFGYSTRSVAAWYAVRALAKKGWIRITPHAARSIVVLHEH